MDLLRLGAQSRKTGLRPRDNLTKDKHDMEDVDEFFEETTWNSSGYDPNTNKNVDPIAAVKIRENPQASSTRRTLGVGKIRPPRKETITFPTLSHTPDISDRNESPEYTPFADFDDPVEVSVENDDPREVDEQISRLSPIPLLSIDNKTDKLASSPSPSPIENRSPVNEKKVVSASKHTKSMALARKRKLRVVESEDEDEVTGDFGGNASLYSDDYSESELSDSQLHPLSSYRPTQPSSMTQPSPLPSPPPEGLRRSKRKKIAPLAFWRNEKIVYSRAEEFATEPPSTVVRELLKAPLQEIKEVVHVPEIRKEKQPARRGRPKGTTNAKGRKLKEEVGSYDYASDPEIEGSEWFSNKFLQNFVFESEDSKVERIVAWSPEGGEFLSPASDPNSQLEENYRFASLFDADSDIIAAGLLDFPFEGFKMLTNTQNKLFIFHVAKGLIEVTLNSDKFVVTRGCSFEVLKHNMYSLKNIGQSTARLFFVLCNSGE